jgi:hypothetical protein
MNELLALLALLQPNGGADSVVKAFDFCQCEIAFQMMQYKLD